MSLYINIHTHRLSNDSGVFVFNNRFGFDPEIYTRSLFSIGIHPWDATLLNAASLKELEKFIIHPYCFAIGECGLDKLKGTDLEIQKIIFDAQLQLAVKHRKPVIIHCVKAFDELIEVCDPYVNKIPLIIHGFNKSGQLAGQLINRGFYISLNPVIFKKQDFDFNVLPVNKLFLETDTSEVSIGEVYGSAASRFNIHLDELKEKISLNFEKVKSERIEHGR